MLKKIKSKLGISGNLKVFFLNCYLFLNINILYSQSDAKIINSIDSSFVLLNNSNLSTEIKTNKVYYPFFYEFEYNEYITEKKIKSGAMCREYKTSRRLEHLKYLYLIISNSDSSYAYSLIDTSGKRIFDLLQTNCGGKNQLGNIDKINQSEITEVLNSYNTWYKLYKKGCQSKSFNQNRNPISFSKFKWVKEIGKVSEKKSNLELIKISELMFNDTIYLSYFIKEYNLKKNFKSTNDDKEIFAELMLLTLINNEFPFTSNILSFKIIKDTSSLGKYKTNTEILKEIIEEVKINSEQSGFSEIISRYNLKVTLDW